MSQSPFHLDLIGTFRGRGNLRSSFSKLNSFPILRLNPAECSYNSQSLRLEIKVVTKDCEFTTGFKI